MRHGVYTFAFAEALRGQADENGDFAVTASEISGYVAKRTAEKVRELKNGARQTPLHTMITADFVVSEIKTKDGIPVADWNAADALYREACSLRRDRNLSQAKTKIDAALKINGKRQEYQDESATIEALLAAEKQKTIDAALTKASDYYKTENFDLAEAELRKVRVFDPKNSTVELLQSKYRQR